MQDHPEVPIPVPTRVNEMILTFNDRFKLINELLIRQSRKSPIHQQAHAHAAAVKSHGHSAAGTKSGDLRRSDAGASVGAPLKPLARVSDQFAANQQLIDLAAAVALANSMPHSIVAQDETASASDRSLAGAGPAGDLVAADESNIDEVATGGAGHSSDESAASGVDDSTPSDEDEDEEEEENPCKDPDCMNVVETSNQAPTSNNISDEQLYLIQNHSPGRAANSPPSSGGEQDQQQGQAHDPPTLVMTTTSSHHHHNHLQHQHQQPIGGGGGGRYPGGSYSTPTVSWTYGSIPSSGYDDSFGRQASAASSSMSLQQQQQQSLAGLLLLLVVSATWISLIRNRQRTLLLVRLS